MPGAVREDRQSPSTAEATKIEDDILEFMDRRLIEEVLGSVRPGKEADLYVCRAGPEAGHRLLAAKVYRERSRRGFRAEETYLEGRADLRRGRAALGSVARAVARRSTAGKALLSEIWVRREYEVLRRLFAEGVPVPRPVACTARAVLMEYLGDEAEAAPRLIDAVLAPDDAWRIRVELLDLVERCLAVGLIHGDLSAYNVLLFGGRPYVIDWPQAVDAAVHPGAEALLARDVRNLTRHFARYGCPDDGPGRALDLWDRWRRGQL